MDAVANTPHAAVVCQREKDERSLRQEAIMKNEALNLPVALRCQDLNEQEVDVLRRLAEDPDPATGVLDWIPRRLPNRSHTGLAS